MTPAEAPRPIDFLDCRSYMRAWFAWRCDQPGRPYTRGKLERASGLSRATLPNVMAGKRVPDARTIRGFAKAAGLSAEEERYLGLLAGLDTAPDAASRSALWREIHLLRGELLVLPNQGSTPEPRPDGAFLAQPECVILRELARAPGGVAVEDLEKLASGMRFGATAASLEEALRELAAFGLVEQENGRYVATSERVISELQSDLSYTRAYHRNMAELGRRGLDILQKERFYLAFTVGVPVGSELLLQHEVERFATFMLDLLEADPRRTGERPAGVYQVNLQLFPLYRAPAKAIDDEPVKKVGD